MRQLVCEMCGGNDLIKENGVFVCQTCGCKYSVEEARKMMFDGDESAPVVVNRPVTVDNSSQIQHYLELAKTAYAGGNGQAASDYADKALELSPKTAEAWIIKMKSVEYLATLGNLRLLEVHEAGKKAISCATTEEEKEKISVAVYRYELTRALDLLKLAMKKLNDTDDIRNTYKRFVAISVFTASKETMDLDSKIVSLYDKIADEARALILLVPDKILENSVSLADLVGECAKQYQYETNALVARYAIYGASLTDAAKRVRESNRRQLFNKADKAKKIAQSREAQRKAAQKAKEAQEHAEMLEAYWAEHAEEKEALESEKASLELKEKEVKVQVQEINKQRLAKADALRKERDKRIPAEIECDEFKREIRDMEIKRDQCGVFKAKEKKELQLKIEHAYAELRDKQKRAQQEKEQYQAEINEQIKETQKIGKDVNDEYKKIVARINEINKELNRN